MKLPRRQFLHLAAGVRHYAYSANALMQVASSKRCVLPRNPLRMQNRGRSMANIGALSIGSLLLSVLALPNTSLAAEYTLMPSPQTVHIGHFTAALKPVLTINSGDIVIVEREQRRSRGT